jgi:hypothetical protein
VPNLSESARTDAEDAAISIVNGYCTLAEAKSLLDITSTSATDDTVLESMIEQASRAIDLMMGRQFYAGTETRYFDVPKDRRLDLDKSLLAITTLTNGNAVTIANTEYNLWPKNGVRHWAVVMKQTSSIIWQPSSAGNTEAVISIAGSWGDVDRAGTDAESVMLTGTTKRACLVWVADARKKRYGASDTGSVTVTAAGVVITPQGAPQDVRDILSILRRMV